MNREQIIAEIRRIAAESEGVPPGRVRFASLTGLSPGAWRGKYWRTWSDALEEAGFVPNARDQARTKEALILSMIAVTRKNGRFPTYADLRMEKQADETFPAHGAFERLGDRDSRIALVRSYASDHFECRDILDLLPAEEANGNRTHASSLANGDADGAVYMLKLGRHYKIGKSFRVPRRHQEIAIELPEKPDVVHVISTDDPSGSRPTGTSGSPRSGRTANGSR